MPEVTRIRVATDASYDVVVGRGVGAELPGLLGEGVRRVALIHPESLTALAVGVSRDLVGVGFEVEQLKVPEAEEAKTAAVAAMCWKALGQAGFTRSDAVVGLGGGATTDLAGFVAATFLRGLRLVQLPTTLLGMVDAAVGGKTGINTEEGKNLVGAFYEPAGVLCDLDRLDTLAPQDLVSGLAEVVKCGFIADEAILGLVEADPAAAVDPRSACNRELVERAISVKAVVVSSDFRESTSRGSQVGREALNYGHTMGHAVERAEHYAFRHGDAVAIGMVYVAELARLAGRLDDATADRHRDTLASLGLPTRYAGAPWPVLHDAMRVDKKSRGDVLRFVVLAGVGHPAILEGPDLTLLTAAYDRLAAG